MTVEASDSCDIAFHYVTRMTDSKSHTSYEYAVLTGQSSLLRILRSSVSHAITSHVSMETAILVVLA